MEELSIEPGKSADYGPCPCCGDMSRKISGYVYADSNAHAAYFVDWTLNQVYRHGAHFDIIVGGWGDGTTAADRRRGLS